MDAIMGGLVAIGMIVLVIALIGAAKASVKGPGFWDEIPDDE
jgi:hypothetical protein